jgi:hypothetical protein
MDPQAKNMFVWPSQGKSGEEVGSYRLALHHAKFNGFLKSLLARCMELELLTSFTAGFDSPRRLHFDKAPN